MLSSAIPASQEQRNHRAPLGSEANGAIATPEANPTSAGNLNIYYKFYFSNGSEYRNEHCGFRKE